MEELKTRLGVESLKVAPSVGDSLEISAGAEEFSVLPIFDSPGAREAGFRSAALRQIGGRSRQQDDYALVTLGEPGRRPAAVAALVADGLQAAGDVASGLAAAVIPQQLRAAGLPALLERYDAAGEDDAARKGLEGEIRNRIKRAVVEAHHQVQKFRALFDGYRQTLGADKEEWQGQILAAAGRIGIPVDFADSKTRGGESPGTTLALVVATPRAAFYAWVGDSRIYHHSPLWGAAPLTVDDTQLRKMVAPRWEKSGLTPLEVSRLLRQKAGQWGFAQENVLSQALGSEKPVQVHQGTLVLQPGDRLLLASDGISHAVEDGEITRTMAAAPDAEQAVRRLMEQAGNGQDNRTALVLDVGESPVDWVARRIGTVGLSEVRVAVLSASLAADYPALKARIGRPPVKLGDAWLLVLPEPSAPGQAAQQLSALLTPIVVDSFTRGRQMQFQEYYSGEKEAPLVLFDKIVRSLRGASVLEQRVGKETGWKERVAWILEKLRGEKPLPEQLRIFEEALPSFA